MIEKSFKDYKPLKIMKTVERPTAADFRKPKEFVIKEPIDVMLLQEISDRLYGPDSEEYIEEIKKLNLKFKKREGRAGGEFYDPEIIRKRRKTEHDITRMIDEDL